MTSAENTPDTLAGSEQRPATDAPAQNNEPDPQQKLNELEAKHAEVADAYLRAKAEAENTRRRAEEEVSKARKFAIEGFADSLDVTFVLRDERPLRITFRV